MSRINPSVQQFFDRHPDARQAYQQCSLYHLTHSVYAPSVLADGLRPNTNLLPAAQGDFLLRVCAQHSTDPNGSVYIHSHIIDPSRVYLSATEPDMKYPGYGVPERLMLLMRSMASLATKSSLTEGERSFARQSFDAHYMALTEGDPQIVALRVDPMAPAIIDSRFGLGRLGEITDPRDALFTIQYLDQYPNNIAVAGSVAPEHITHFAQTPLDTDKLRASVHAEPSWTTPIK